MNLAGKTTLGQLAGLIESAALFVSNDTGPLHMAEALDTRCVGIFTGLEFDMWKLVSPRSASVRKDIPCSPCGDKACAERKCLKELSVDDVMAAVRNVLVN